MIRNSDDTTTNGEPLFNIGTVSRMTDIPETTLRVWERRYNFPKSARTSSGHRLYSQHEVLRLQWVKSRLDEGMQISQSIRALKKAEQEQPLIPPQSNTTESFNELTGYQHLELYRHKLFNALINHDAIQADQIMSEAFMRYPVETMVLDIVAPLLNEIGEAWCRDEITVGTEHFSSHFLRLNLSMWMRTAPQPYNVDPIILACPPGELHEGGLLMLAVLLRRLRWPVMYLGQNMPLEGLNQFIDEFSIAVIVFSAASRETALNLKDWQYTLLEQHNKKHLIVSYGGAGFNDNPELINQVEGIFLGETLPEAIEMLNRILHEVHPSLG